MAAAGKTMWRGACYSPVRHARSGMGVGLGRWEAESGREELLSFPFRTPGSRCAVGLLARIGLSRPRSPGTVCGGGSGGPDSGARDVEELSLPHDLFDVSSIDVFHSLLLPRMRWNLVRSRKGVSVEVLTGHALARALGDW